MFFSATFGFAVYDYVVWLKFPARFLAIHQEAMLTERAMQVWLQSCTCL